MSRSIDERIVQMTFNNEDFERNANRTISTLNDLNKSLDFSGLQTAFISVGKSFNAFEEIAVGALRRIGEQAEASFERLLKSFTIDPILQGWGKFDQMITSEQTIMSAVEGKSNPLTGEIYDLDAVLERIDKLRWYSDETSYSMDQMTTAIGNFTSAGIDLDDATTMVMGISNAAADAGVSVQKAEHAYLGFSKAIASGSLTLSTWNMQLRTSGITNSERFRQSLIDAGVAMGNLEKKTRTVNGKLEEYYVTTAKTAKSGLEVSIANITDAFAKSRWATSDVLREALNSYSNTVQAIFDLTDSGQIDLTAKVFDDLNKAMKEQGETVESLHLNEEYDQASLAIGALRKAYEKLGLEVPKSIKAFARAQEAVTFGQAIESIQTAVTSGWAKTYETIFGNYDEAKALWTDVANDLYDVFVEPGNARNEFLSEWKSYWTKLDEIVLDNTKSGKQYMEDFSTSAERNAKVIKDANDLIEKELYGGDYEQPLTQMQAMWHAIAKVIEEVQTMLTGVWEDIFESADAVQIFTTIENIRGFILDIATQIRNVNESLTDGSTRFDAIRDVIEGILTTFKTIKSIGDQIWSSLIKPIMAQLKPVLDDIFGIFGNFGKMLTDSGNALMENMSPVTRILKGILDILTPIITAIGNVVHGFKEWTDSLANNNLEEDAEKLGIFGRALQFVGNIFEWVAKIFNGTINAFQAIGDVLGGLFEKIKGTIGDLLASHGTDVSGLAEGGFLGILAYGLASVIAKFKKMDLKTIIETIKGVFTDSKSSFFGRIKYILEQVSTALNTFTQSIKVKMLKEIASAALILAGALLVLSLVDGDRIASSLAAMMAVLGEALATMTLLDKINGGKLKTSVFTLMTVATSIIMLSVALKMLASIDPERVGSSLLLLGGALGIIAIFIGALNLATKRMQGAKVESIGSSLKSIGLALIEIALALKIAASINPDELKTALIGLGSALGGVLVFVIAIAKLTNGKGLDAIGKVGAAMIGMGLALIEMSLALKILGTMNIAQMGIALLGLLTGLGAIFGFAVGVSKLAGAGSFAALSISMVAMASGLLILSAALKVMSSMSWAQLGKGLAVVAGSLGALGIAALVLQGLTGPMLLVSAAIAAFGAALLIASQGIIAFVGAYGLMSAIGQDISNSLLNIMVEAVASLIELLPSVILGIGKAIVNIGGELVAIVTQLVGILIDALMNNVPRIIDTSLELMFTLLAMLRENAQRFAEVGGDIIANFLRGAAEKIDDIIIAAAQLVGSFAIGIGQAVPILVDAGLRMITDFLNGLAEAIRSNAGEIGAAFGNLAAAIVEGIITGFGSVIASFGGNLLSFGSSIIDGIVGLFSGGDANEEAQNTGGDLVTSVSAGIEANRDFVYQTAAETGQETAKNMDASKEAVVSGKNTLEGLIVGLQDSALLSQIWQEGLNAGNTYMEAYRSVLDINSPSRKMEQFGLYTIAGLVRGLSDASEVENAGESVGNILLDSISKAADAAEEVLSSDLNPVISPVLDLSDVTSGASAISSLLDSDASYKAALAVNSANLATANNQNGAISSPVINIDFTINKAGGELTEFDISQYGKQIADEVNVRLGKLLWR